MSQKSSHVANPGLVNVADQGDSTTIVPPSDGRGWSTSSEPSVKAVATVLGIGALPDKFAAITSSATRLGEET